MSLGEFLANAAKSKIVPRLSIAITQAGAKPAVGDTVRIVVPDGWVLSNPAIKIDRGDGNGLVVLASAMSAVLQQLDLPPIGGDWPIVPEGQLTKVVGTPFRLRNPPVAPDAPTVGSLVTVDGTTAIQSGTAPANTGGADISGYVLEIFRASNDVLLGTFSSATLPVTATDLPTGVSVYGKLRAVNSTGPGSRSAKSNNALVADLLAVACNQRPKGTSTTAINPTGAHPSRTAFCIRACYDIGSGNPGSFVISLTNQVYNRAATSTITVNSVYIQDDAGNNSILVPGNYPYVVVTNTNDMQLPEFDTQLLGPIASVRGTRWWIRTDGTVPLNAVIPQGADRMSGNISTKQLFSFFDPSVTTLSAPSIPGKPTVTGTALPITSGGGWCPVLLGRFAGAHDIVLGGTGDSNVFAPIDTTAHERGKGCLQYAQRGDDSAGQLLAGINISVTGVSIAGLTANPDNAYWAKYCNVMLLQPAGNTFGLTGSVSAATVMAAMRVMIDQHIAAAPKCKRLGFRIGPHTVPAAGYTLANAGTLVDQSDQDLLPGYEKDGPVDQYTEMLKALVGKPDGFHGFVDAPLWRSGSDPRKWPATGTFGSITTDLTHCLAIGELDKGAAIRAVAMSV